MTKLSALLALKDSLAVLYKRRCLCVRCVSCGGSGLMETDSYGYPESDINTCDEPACSGGIIEVCERCAEVEELEQQIEELNQEVRP